MQNEVERRVAGRLSGGEMRFDWDAWRYYFRFYRGSERELLASICAALGQAMLLLPITLLIREAFDRAIPSHNSALLVGIGGAVLGLYLLNAGVALWTFSTILTLTKRVIQRLRDDLVKKVYTLPRSYYSRADLGRLHANIVQDTERLDIMTNALVEQLLPALVICAALMVVLLALNWVLCLVLACIAPLLLLVNRLIGRAVQRRTEVFLRSFERFSSGVSVVLRLLDLTWTQSAVQLEVARQRGRHEELRRTSGAMAWAVMAYTQIQTMVVAVSSVVVLVVGGAFIASGAMTVGGLLSFFVGMALVQSYAGTIARTIPRVIAGSESLTSLYAIVTLEHPQPYTGRTRIPFSGRLALEGVTFQYADSPLLRDVSFAVRPGDRVAIVGPNGAGKSTIISLILGFYRPQHGQLWADDQQYDALDLVHLRQRMGVVAQDPMIFAGTIAENITYGCPDARPEQLIRAAEIATAHEFIGGLPQGYETVVGEDGVLLSGGQRQRIAIARAILRHPALLLLDEPTNHLDATAIHQLMQNLRALDEQLAIVVISHDHDVVRECERVYLLEAGQLVEMAASAPSRALAQDDRPLGQVPREKGRA